MIVGIDPGHGGRDRSNRGPTGYVEADGTLAMALACRDELRRVGVEVVMTREADVDLAPAGRPYSQGADLHARSKLLNDAGAEVVLDIHTNAAGAPEARGVELYRSVASPPEKGTRLAGLILEELRAATGFPSRDPSVRTRENDAGHDYYHMIRETRGTAVIVEVGFHTNPQEERRLKDPMLLAQAGLAIARGTLAYLGMSPAPAAGTFPDVPRDHWAAEAIRRVAGAGLLEGRSDGRFGLGEGVTREELAVVLDRLIRRG